MLQNLNKISLTLYYFNKVIFKASFIKYSILECIIINFNLYEKENIQLKNIQSEFYNISPFYQL